MVDVFEGEFPRLGKSNSFSIDGLLFYIRKENNGYVAYEYKSKLKIVGTNGGDRLRLWLAKNIKQIKERINERQK